MKASDLEKVQSLLRARAELATWLYELEPEVDDILHDPIVSLGDASLALDRDSDTGREVLALLGRHVADEIAGIDAELRSLGVEP